MLWARVGPAASYGRALLLLAPLLLTGLLAIVLTPADALATEGVSIARVTSLAAAVGVLLRAVGEEVFFRGLLGGIFIRRMGFLRGNLLQAAVFLLPHLLLLLIDGRLWPILPVQFVAGWLLGWLRHESSSIVPGSVVHAMANVLAGIIAA